MMPCITVVAESGYLYIDNHSRSELSEGVQMADLCAYNVYHSASYNKPDYSFFKRMLPVYYNSQNTPVEKIDGLKVFPDTSEHLCVWLGQIHKKPLRTGA